MWLDWIQGNINRLLVIISWIGLWPFTKVSFWIVISDLLLYVFYCTMLVSYCCVFYQRPPGVMCVMDDVCATMHAVGEGADATLLEVSYHAIHPFSTSISDRKYGLEEIGIRGFEIISTTMKYCISYENDMWPWMLNAKSSPVLLT